jgi:hypothetical protein
MKRKIPNNLKDYLPGRSAAAQLIQCALECVLFKRTGILVHWELTLRYHYAADFEPSKEMLALPMKATMHSSGPEPTDPADEQKTAA